MISRDSGETGAIAMIAILGSTVVLVLFALVFSYKAMALSQNHLHQCHKEMLAAQKEQAKTLRRLLNLNPLAKTLRKMRKVATRARNAARSNPAALAAAQAALEAIKAKQRALRAKQLAIVASSKASWAKSQTYSRAQNNRSAISYSHPPAFPVKRTPDKWGSPTYKALPRLSTIETSRLSWILTIPISTRLIAKALKAKSIAIEISCSSTLKQRGSKWVPVLIQAKPSLKSA